MPTSPGRLTAAITAEIAPVRAPALATAIAAVAWALWIGGLSPVTPALVVAAAAGAALTVIDLRSHRLPNVITYPTTAAVAVLLVLAAAVGGTWSALGRAALGAAALGGAYLVLHLVNRSGMGLGDVKLAPMLGGVAAWFGWSTLAGAAILPFLIGGVVSVALLAARRATRKTALAFGPFMLAGAALALTWARVAA
ncbi:prepilin peptidase [Xylanimonas allomyrinae]|uniref:Prepilin peptidase n=1 Tax=Xylanimonas allomyrinae TaxID=2509459 RepID=A0A4P6ER57_9MICO|nr:A24 family peptidase [Xylanimonas allomyrinae]QAY64373.1 prepilin peptidase [Xylanimonas allomyrinae]